MSDQTLPDFSDIDLPPDIDGTAAIRRIPSPAAPFPRVVPSAPFARQCHRLLSTRQLTPNGDDRRG